MEKIPDDKNPSQFSCSHCNYFTSSSKDFKKHLLTKKHQGKSGNPPETSKSNLSCHTCGKLFKSQSGLWKHNKKGDCRPSESVPVEQPNKPTVEQTNQLLEFLIKENKELRDLILEVVKSSGSNTTMNNSHNTHTNSHNKAFNLNFFLNETCKNAMNITDFVDSIKLQLSDLMDVGELGYVEGISKIIVKNLNNLDETERPIHCTDKKRETFYVKDEGQWEKEDDNKTKLRKFVQKIADKNIRLLPQYREKYPDYGNAYSRTSDFYNKMVIEAMETDVNKDDKIIRKLTNATVIGK